MPNQSVTIRVSFTQIDKQNAFLHFKIDWYTNDESSQPDINPISQCRKIK